MTARRTRDLGRDLNTPKRQGFEKGFTLNPGTGAVHEFRQRTRETRKAEKSELRK